MELVGGGSVINGALPRLVIKVKTKHTKNRHVKYTVHIVETSLVLKRKSLEALSKSIVEYAQGHTLVPQ